MIKNIDSMEKMNLRTNENALKVNSETELNTPSSAQSISQKILLTTKVISVNKLLSYVLPQVLLIAYIIRRYESSIQEKIMVSDCDLSESGIRSSTNMVREIQSRMMAQMDAENDESFEVQEVPSEQVHDWTSGLSEHTIQTCNEYLDKGKELKDRIFLNNAELNTFLSELNQKKEIVKIYAPQLLNKEENEDIRKAKVLQYYTPNGIADSIIWRLKKSIYYYYDAFRYFRDERQAIDENDKIYNLAKIERFKRRLKFLDPSTFVVVQNKLENLKQQLKSSSTIKRDYLFEIENRTITQALRMCQAYIDVLESLGVYDEPSMKRKSIYVLYNIEKVLASKVRDFCEIYNEEQESAL